MLSTVRKAGLVLDLFVDGQSEWGVTEVATELEVPKSGAHSILATLTEIGLLERTEEKRYRLGWQVVALSRVVLETAAVRTAAVPVMYRLAAQHGASSYLMVRERGRALCIERATCRSTASPDAPKVGDYVELAHPAAKALLLGRACEAEEDVEGPLRQATAVITACGVPRLAVLSVTLDASRFTASAASLITSKAGHHVTRRLITHGSADPSAVTFSKDEHESRVPSVRA